MNCERLNAEILDSAGPQLKTIVLGTAGFDYVDMTEIENRGIRFGYTPNVPNDAVADLAIGLMIAAGRRFREGFKTITDGKWQLNDPKWMLGQDIKGSTVGIVGMGRIGQVIAKRLKGFEVEKIIYSGKNEKQEGEHRYFSQIFFIAFLHIYVKWMYEALSCQLWIDNAL